MQLIVTLCLVFISVTMLVRANDIKRERCVKCRTRMVGLVMAGIAPWGMVLLDWSANLLIVGVTLVFLTTPGLPPWHRLIWRGE